MLSVPPPPIPVEKPPGRLLLLAYLLWLAEEPLLDKDWVSLRIILEWIKSNPPLVDVYKLSSWSETHSVSSTFSFALALIEKSQGKQEQRAENVRSFKRKQHDRFAG